ncbi:MAG: hypothetical protein MK207_01720 [Saprospiraceae bacterium]|nr:hypothetical protein [Saprospiraceae bacterium]
MKFLLLYLFLILFIIGACKQNPPIKTEANLTFDHVLIFCKGNEFEDSLSQLFTFADKLSSKHPEQGTMGRYILVMNSFIELLYIEDSAKVKNNEDRFRSPYLNRWDPGSACPFAFGLILEPYDSTTCVYPFEAYRSLDIPQEAYYLMSVANKDASQPMIYASPKERAHRTYEDISEIYEIEDDNKRRDLKKYMQHPSGIQRLTSVIISLPSGEIIEGNLKILNELKEVETVKAEGYQLTLVFDEAKQGKSFDIVADIDVRIEY